VTRERDEGTGVVRETVKATTVASANPFDEYVDGTAAASEPVLNETGSGQPAFKLGEEEQDENVPGNPFA